LYIDKILKYEILKVTLSYSIIQSMNNIDLK